MIIVLLFMTNQCPFFMTHLMLLHRSGTPLLVTAIFWGHHERKSFYDKFNVKFYSMNIFLHGGKIGFGGSINFKGQISANCLSRRFLW